MIIENLKEIPLEGLVDNYLKQISINIDESCQKYKKKKMNIKKCIKFDILNEIIIFQYKE